MDWLIFLSGACVGFSLAVGLLVLFAVIGGSVIPRRRDDHTCL